MVSEIVFHLGDPKTGSTSIQDTLRTENWICPQTRIIYPARINHIDLAKSLAPEAAFWAKSFKFRGVARRISGSDADIAVISAEYFNRVDPKVLQAAIHKYLPKYADTIRLVAYVRPHADRLVSAFAERVKVGYFTGTLPELHASTKRTGTFMYNDRFLAWRAVFGARFTLRPMIRSELLHRCVVEDFLNFTFNGADFQLVEKIESNKSLSLEDLAMIRELHLVLRTKSHLEKTRTSVGLNMGRILASMPTQTGTKLRLPESLVQDVIETYALDAKRLDDAFFSGTPMTQALMAARDNSTAVVQSIKAEDNFDPNQLRAIWAWRTLTLKLLEVSPWQVSKKFKGLREIELIERAERLGHKRQRLEGP